MADAGLLGGEFGNGIVQLDHAVWELLAGDQFEWHGAATRRD
jgi:hypothetical protein